VPPIEPRRREVPDGVDSRTPIELHEILIWRCKYSTLFSDSRPAPLERRAVTRGITRRSFLQGTGGALALSLGSLRWSPPAAAAPDAQPPAGKLGYRGFEDLYRQRWTWDRVAKGTHYVNCWYQRACSWNVFVKDGVVWREEQAGLYPQTRPELPDFNPRGCQKGACYSERMADAGRLRHPLRRVGRRGQGRWKRISWEKALREIADRSIDVLASDGPGAVLWDQGSQHANGCAALGMYRTSFVLDTPTLDMGGELGDHHPGAVATCGKMAFASSADDVFYSDLILIWGGNPTYTQIPNAHFINEARYNGARVVTIAPDFNASAVHADEWIPVRIASDAALGLSLAHVIVEEGLADRAFLREQTDLPLLVRTDDRRFLRERDVERGGAEDGFYVFDRRSSGIRPVSRKTLAPPSKASSPSRRWRARSAWRRSSPCCAPGSPATPRRRCGRPPGCRRRRCGGWPAPSRRPAAPPASPSRTSASTITVSRWSGPRSWSSPWRARWEGRAPAS
jgi:anaerobic selenocysteine-containing dehydrogenase